jgi:hypothetical protein
VKDRRKREREERQRERERERARVYLGGRGERDVDVEGLLVIAYWPLRFGLVQLLLGVETLH